jgi:hypothetical protein
VFENRVLRGIFKPKREVTGGWSKLHNEELHNMYCSPSVIRITRLARQVACIIEKINTYRILVGKLERKRQLGRIRCRWEDDIKMNLREMGCSGMDWIDLAQDRDQWRPHLNTVMKHRDLKHFGEVPLKLSDCQVLNKDSAPWR